MTAWKKCLLGNRVFSEFNGTGNLVAIAPAVTVVGALPPGVYAIGDQSIWTAFFRVQRNYAAAGAE
jgi:hypothetical protein